MVGKKISDPRQSSHKHVIEAKVPRITEMLSDSQRALRDIATEREHEKERQDSVARASRNPFANARLTETSHNVTAGVYSPTSEDTELQKAMARSYTGTLSALLSESRSQLPKARATKDGEPEPLVLMRKSTDFGRHSMIQSQILRLKAAAKRKEPTRK